MVAETLPANSAPHPVSFDVEYPEPLSRWRTFFRLLLAIPQLIIAHLLSSLLGILAFIAWFSILFTGRYPKSFFEVSVGAMRWMANVVAYAALLRDEYPPFSWEPGDYSLTLDIERAERQSRFRLFIRYFAILPNQIVLNFVQIAWLFTTVIAWFAILATGKYPRGLFRFGVGVMRWYQRQVAYVYMLRDEYPPYSINADARSGNEVASAIIGFPLYIGFIALSLLPFLGLLGTGTDTVAVQSALTSPQLRVEMPSGEANGIRLTILGYDDDAPQPPGTVHISGHRFVSFQLLAEKDGFLPMFFTPFLLRLHDQQGFRYFPKSTSDGFEFEFFWRGGEENGFVVFQIPRGASPADLVLQAGFGRIKFVFGPES